MATTKEELPVSGMRYVVVTRHRGTSVVRSLKLVHPPHFSTRTRINNNNQTPHCDYSYLAGETNTYLYIYLINCIQLLVYINNILVAAKKIIKIN